MLKSIEEARKLWRDKVLWINYPVSFHLKEPEEIRVYTKKLLQEAVPGDKFLISNTENLTPGVWQKFMRTVVEVLQSEKLPLTHA